MVQFEERGFVIRIETGTNPIEDWMGLHEELLQALSSINESEVCGKVYYHILGLLQDMMPEWEICKKML
jgi:hypothetical protein